MLLSLFSALFHFSFLSAFLVLVIYFFVGNRLTLFYVLLIASFIIPEISIGYAQYFAEFLGEGVVDRAARYTADTTIEARAARGETARELGKWYLYLPGLTMRYYFLFAFFFVKFKFKHIVNTREMKNIYAFSLLFFAFANFVAVIPSMARFYTIFYLFAAVFIFNIMLKLRPAKLDILTLLGFIPFFAYDATRYSCVIRCS